MLILPYPEFGLTTSLKYTALQAGNLGAPFPIITVPLLNSLSRGSASSSAPISNATAQSHPPNGLTS